MAKRPKINPQDLNEITQEEFQRLSQERAAQEPEQPPQEPITVLRKRALHGGKRRGAGRPSTRTKTTAVAVRLTDLQRETFARLGGADWLRDLLDQQS